MHTIANYIGGELVEPASGEYFDNFEPATATPYSLTPDSDERDVNLAADAAKAAMTQVGASARKDMPLLQRREIV
mgnify:CR=1 FL=1